MRAESPNNSHSDSMSVDLMSNTQKKFHMSQIELNKIYDLNMLLPRALRMEILEIHMLWSCHCTLFVNTNSSYGKVNTKQ